MQVPANMYERQGIRASKGFTGLILPPGLFVISQFSEVDRQPLGLVHLAGVSWFCLHDGGLPVDRRAY